MPSGMIKVEHNNERPNDSPVIKSTLAPDSGYALDSVAIESGSGETEKMHVSQFETILNDGYKIERVTKDYTIKVVFSPDNDSDGIPDKYQSTVTFKVVNGYWGEAGATPSDGADKIVVLTRKDGENYSENTAVHLSIGDIPVAGNNPATNYTAGSRDTTPDTKTEINSNKIYTYTYTASSSEPGGGTSSNPRLSTPPAVLDTEEHYAYIIGLPGGEVQPGSSLTRAEIVTIRFRLLTDEARETYRGSADALENSFVFA